MFITIWCYYYKAVVEDANVLNVFFFLSYEISFFLIIYLAFIQYDLYSVCLFI